jgi:hypothetical protein
LRPQRSVDPSAIEKQTTALSKRFDNDWHSQAVDILGKDGECRIPLAFRANLAI